MRWPGATLRSSTRRSRLTRISRGKPKPPAGCHHLRILFKRLRYTCEYFNDLYGGAFDGAIARFVRFQDCLGKYQDAVVASALLDGLKASGGPLKTSKTRDCPYLNEANNKLQVVMRERRGLQREAFSELWSEFPLILRAFDKLLRSVPPVLPASPAAVGRPAPGG